MNRATTLKILGVVTNYYIPERGKPASIITDHGTKFKGRRWKNILITLGIKTYKTSVYHPSSNPAERVLREVGRILRTYCHNQQRKWQEYLSATEEFLNLAYHPTIGTTPYTAMYEKQPPREIQEIIEFPVKHEYKFNRMKFYNKLAEDQERRHKKYQKAIKKVINYEVGEKVLLKNRELPSTLEGITKKLLLLYTCLLYTSRCV